MIEISRLTFSLAIIAGTVAGVFVGMFFGYWLKAMDDEDERHRQEKQGYQSRMPIAG